MKVAIIHDWLVTYGGAEKVLEEQLNLFPSADIYTLLHQPGSQSPIIESKQIRTSSLQRVPVGDHRKLIALMPYAVEQFDMSGYDLVLSNTFAVTHGVISTPEQLHVAYVNRTMRYAWDTYHEDLGAFGLSGGIKRLAASLGYHYLRLWDLAAFQRPDQVIANSPFSARRIQKYYRREAATLFPPVDTELFRSETKREDFYVTVGRLVSLKGVDLMVEAFTRSGRKLVVVGDGPMLEALRARAGKTVTFTGKLSSPEVAKLLARARGYVAMAEEDFGIANVEALASGCPVVGWRRGGIVYTVQHGENGVLFDERSAEGLNAALETLERSQVLPPDIISRNAQVFSGASYRARLGQHIERQLKERPQ